MSAIALPWGMPLANRARARAARHPLLSPWRLSLFTVLNVIVLPIPSDCGPRCEHGAGVIRVPQPLPGRVSGAPSSAPSLLGNVRVAPFEIVPRPLEGATENLNGEALRKHLSEEATQQAIRTLLRHNMAEVRGDASKSGSATGDGLSMTGSVRLPLSLPPGVIGLRASSRKGPFATAVVTLKRSDGSVLASEERTLRWKDVRWTRGGRVRRNRKVDDVLANSVRKSVDHAVRRLRRNPALRDGEQRDVPAH